MFILAKKMELKNPQRCMKEFDKIKKEIEESINLKDKLKNKTNCEHICVTFRKYKKGKDERLLANMQNDFFKYGRVLSEYDIINRFNQEDIIDDLALFLCINDIPVGFAQIINTDDGFMLGSVGIITDYRGLGLGKLLVSNIVLTGINLGIDNLHLYVTFNNTYAKRLYSSLGFIYRGYNIQYSETQIIKKFIYKIMSSIKSKKRKDVYYEKKSYEKMDTL